MEFKTNLDMYKLAKFKNLVHNKVLKFKNKHIIRKKDKVQDL